MYLFEATRKGPDWALLTDLGLHFRFSKLREDHGEEVGMLRVYSVDYPGREDGTLFNGKVILSGPRSKADVVKSCQIRCPSFGGWLDLVDGACDRMLGIRADGEPFVDLSLGDVAPVAPWLLEPLMRCDEHTLIFGPGGSGKSTIALVVGLALAAGIGDKWDMAGVGTSQRVGYLDYEDSEDNFKRRLRALAAGAKVACPPLLYKRGEASLTLSADSLGRQCADMGLTGLIIDSAGLACGAEPERADSANAYFRALRGLPISWSLTIAHQPKDKENSGYPFGSIFWWNNPRMIWKLSGSQKDGGLGITLIHRKANNGMLQPNIGFQFKYEAETATLERQEPGKYVGVQEYTEGKQEDRIQALLRDKGGLFPNEIGAQADIPTASLYTVLTRMLGNGKLQKNGPRYETPGDELPFG